MILNVKKMLSIKYLLSFHMVKKLSNNTENLVLKYMRRQMTSMVFLVLNRYNTRNLEI